jgi:hypothetical protein
MPIDYRKYPDNWKRISKDVIQKAGNACEWCGVRNRAVGVRNQYGEFVELPHLDPGQMVGSYKVFVIVLTVAHLDHNPANCDYSNLRALCQKCHLSYDHQHHMANAAATRRRKRETLTDQLSMLEV